MRRIVSCAALLPLLIACAANASPVRCWGLAFDYRISGFEWAGDYWPEFDEKMRTGYGVTAFMEWFDRPAISLRTGISYAQRGGALEWVSPNAAYPPERYTDDLRLDYLTLSAVLKLRYETRVVCPYACIGPLADFYLGHVQQCESNYDEGACWQAPMAFSETGYRSVVYGFSVGGGLELPMSVEVTPFLEFLYERSVSGAIAGVPPDSFERAEGDYECYTISGGFMF